MRIVLAILTFLALGALPAQAASFDCAKASAPDEVAICKNPELSELDTRMGALWFSYSKVPFLMGANGARHDAASVFLEKRKACGGDVACLRAAYAQRIAELKENIERAMVQVRQQENAVAALELPPSIQNLVSGYDKQCRDLGGTLEGTAQPMIATADFDRDSLPDFLLNPANLSCTAAATAFCGNGGCQIKIALSRDSYAKPIDVLGGQPTLTQKEKQTEVSVWVDGANCNTSDRTKACWSVFNWDEEGAVKQAYEVRPVAGP